MDDSAVYMAIAGSFMAVIGIVALAFYSWKFHQVKAVLRKVNAGIEQLPYDRAVEKARELLQLEYHGYTGLLQPYLADPRFDFTGYSSETMKKVIQPSNKNPNTRYIQKILDDLAPGKFKALPPQATLKKLA